MNRFSLYVLLALLVFSVGWIVYQGLDYLGMILLVADGLGLLLYGMYR